MTISVPSQLRPVLAVKTFLLFLLCVLFAAPAAFAWGCQGHEIVALIAEAHLNPRALAMANDILKNAPVDPNVTRFCKEEVDAFAASSTWPDDIRRVRPEATPWHFIDIPRDAKQSDIEKYCPQDKGCILSALKAQFAVLQSNTTDPKARADALRFVIHFIGDMHQPLHDVDNGDFGGNCVPVAFFGTQPQLRNPQTESYAPNLHGVWDTDILVHSMGQKTVQQLADELPQRYASQLRSWQKLEIVTVETPSVAKFILPSTFDKWSWETHLLAEQYVYGKLPTRIPVEAPVHMAACSDNNHVSTRMLALHEDLEQPYEDAATPVVHEQLAKAGIRLAAVLNALWPNN